MKNEVFKIYDTIIYGIIATVILLTFLVSFGLFGSSGKYLSVKANGSETVYSLSDNQKICIESNGYVMNVCIENGEASVQGCTCPDKICQYSGKIKNKDETIVCVPAQIILVITGGKESEVDDVAE